LKLRPIIILIILCLIGSMLSAAVPSTMNYQGRIKFNASGSPVPDGNGNTVTFGIFNASSGGSSLWSETWSSATSCVTTTAGLFNVVLGSWNPIVLPFDQQYYLEVTWFNGASPETMSPRQPLTVSPYAFKAKYVEGPISLTSSSSTTSIYGSNSSVGGWAVEGSSGNGIGVLGVGQTGTAGSAASPGGIGVLAGDGGQPGALGLQVSGSSLFGASGIHTFAPGSTVNFTGATVNGLPGVSVPLNLNGTISFPGGVITATNTGSGFGMVGYDSLPGGSIGGTPDLNSSLTAGVKGYSAVTNSAGVAGYSNLTYTVGVGTLGVGMIGVGGFGRSDVAGSIGGEFASPAAGGLGIFVPQGLSIFQGAVTVTASAVWGTSALSVVQQQSGGGGSAIFGFTSASATAGVYGQSTDITAPNNNGTASAGVVGKGSIGVAGTNAYPYSIGVIGSVDATGNTGSIAVAGFNQGQGLGGSFKGLTGLSASSNNGGGVGIYAQGSGGATALLVNGDSSFVNGTETFPGSTVNFTGATVIGLGGVSAPLSLTSPSQASALSAFNSNPFGDAVYGSSGGSQAAALYGSASGTSGYGVYGISSNFQGVGVYGQGSGPVGMGVVATGQAVGVSASSGGIGLIASGTTLGLSVTGGAYLAGPVNVDATGLLANAGLTSTNGNTGISSQAFQYGVNTEATSSSQAQTYGVSATAIANYSFSVGAPATALGGNAYSNHDNAYGVYSTASSGNGTAYGAYHIGSGPNSVGMYASGATAAIASGVSLGLSVTASSVNGVAIYGRGSSATPIAQFINDSAGSPLQINGMKFPSNDGGIAGSVLKTDGFGDLSFAAPSAPAAPMDLTSSGAASTIYATNTGTTGNTMELYEPNSGTSGSALFVHSNINFGSAVFVSATSATGISVFGWGSGLNASSTNGTAVIGASTGVGATGVQGSGYTGVVASGSSYTSGWQTYGLQASASAVSPSTTAMAVRADSGSSTGGTAYGVFADAGGGNNNIGVYGTDALNPPQSISAGVYGYSINNPGVWAQTNSLSFPALIAQNTNGTLAISATAVSGGAIYARSADSTGGSGVIFAQSDGTAPAIVAQASGVGLAAAGTGAAGIGVIASAGTTSGTGVSGSASSSGAIGVAAVNTSTIVGGGSAGAALSVSGTIKVNPSVVTDSSAISGGAWVIAPTQNQAPLLEVRRSGATAASVTMITLNWTQVSANSVVVMTWINANPISGYSLTLNGSAVTIEIPSTSIPVGQGFNLLAINQ
jgi:hypothetical protein